MLNPLHVAFTLMGRMLDVLFPRPKSRPGPALGSIGRRAPDASRDRKRPVPAR
jgi:hypothetical protein